MVNNPPKAPARPAAASKIAHLDNQVEETKAIAHQTLQEMINRGERLEDIDAKAKQLEEGSKKFQKTTVGVKRTMWWRNAKWTMILIIVIIIILAAIIIPVALQLEQKKN